MTVINTLKDAYNEFKAFKPLSVPFNFSSYIIIDGRGTKNGENLKLFFSRDSDFFITFGELSLLTEFGKWLSEKVVKIQTEDFSKIGKTLKKNVVSVSYSDAQFIFEALDEDGNNIKYIFENNKTTLSSVNLENIMSKCSQPIILDKNLLKEDIFEIYLDKNNTITTENSENEILLEVPVAKLNALLKDTKTAITECYISYSDIIDNTFRYVCFSSCNSELKLKLSQLFLTV